MLVDEGVRDEGDKSDEGERKWSKT